MKRFLLLVFILSSFNLIVYGQGIKVPDHKLQQSEIANKTISELWLMRNAIFAKYGRPFKTYELNAYFMSQKWYKINLKFKHSDLNQTDLYNIDFLYKQENILRQNNYSSSKKVNFNNVYNIFQYPNFTADEKDKLSKNGFGVLPTDAQQIFHIYENNDYLGIPSFITVDAVLQLYHLYFDMTLRTVEENYLLPKLETLIDELIKDLLVEQKNTSNQNVKKSIDYNLAYLGVAKSLIDSDNVDIYGSMKNIAQEEVNNCKEHGGWKDSPFLGRKFDYSQFIPRGHYTRNEDLKRFFVAMMWLSNAGIEVDKEQNILGSVILTNILYSKKYNNKFLIEMWKDIYEPTVFYVGLSDDTGPLDVKKEIDNLFPNIAKIDDFDNSAKLKQLAANLPEEKISGHGDWAKQKKQFRFIGQRFVPDSYIFDQLTSDKRKMPNCLDIMAGFGNKTAYDLMMTDFKSSWEKFPDYPKILNLIIKQNADKTEAQWKQNLYYHWLYNIIALYDIKNTNDLPFFMKTKAWQVKTLNTAMASWTELRHNTILFVKESYGAECGGDGYEKNEWIPGPPKGYVEPNLEFYNRMLSLMNFTIDGLAKRGMLDNRVKYIGKDFVDLLTFLKTVTEKELNKEELTAEEYIQIQKIGSLLDNLTLRVLTDGYETWDDLEGPDKNMPVIADVHTADFNSLEVGVGKPQTIYVIVEINGKLKLTRGAIFSYYEFAHPISDRLTDEKWQEMLNNGTNPLQPSWINYKSKSLKDKNIQPLYKPKNPDTPDYSKEPGWNVIYYDTGC